MRMRRMRMREIVSPAVEVKMLRSAQRRIRERTERLACLGIVKKPEPEPAAPPGTTPEKPEAAVAEAPEPEPELEPEAKDQASDPLHEQARLVAEAEEALAKLTRALIEKYPLIDDLLLGKDEEAERAILGIPGDDEDPKPRDKDRGAEGKEDREDREGQEKPQREGEGGGSK